MKALTIDQEQSIRERMAQNKRDAEGRRLFADLRRREILDLNPLELQCVVCGTAMKAQRQSKKTCSARCRLRLSRWLRAHAALPKAELRKRDAELRRRWRRAASAVKAEEKGKSKRSREEILTEFVADIKALNAELAARSS
jgi:hypothetical protein